jgi:hypothetical protein
MYAFAAGLALVCIGYLLFHFSLILTTTVDADLNEYLFRHPFTVLALAAVSIWNGVEFGKNFPWDYSMLVPFAFGVLFFFQVPFCGHVFSIINDDSFLNIGE